MAAVKLAEIAPFRVEADLLGRFMLPDRSESPCAILSVSNREIEIMAPEAPAAGTRIICYADQIGRIEGRAGEPTDFGFTLVLDVTADRLKRIAEAVGWMSRAETGQAQDGRRHGRLVPRNTSVMIRSEDVETWADLIDISISGAAIRSAMRPRLGQTVTVGRTTATVVRHLDNGFGVQFEQQLPVERFGADAAV